MVKIPEGVEVVLEFEYQDADITAEMEKGDLFLKIRINNPAHILMNKGFI